ncbi:peptidoglycan-binding domain-containing protein [Persicimonas caeni]|uniref:peptidoglycan-binding domain-containing protein n=1 Tax=Persicimonas caeni TaxID=2292766 RepID=UPI00143D7DF6|nr:peptidoglycan-binding domain-containing protein [Persicimonas caeni]
MSCQTSTVASAAQPAKAAQLESGGADTVEAAVEESAESPASGQVEAQLAALEASDRERYAKLPAEMRRALEQPRSTRVEETATLRESMVARKTTVSVDDDGRFDFSLPPSDSVDGPIRLTLKSPVGGVLVRRDYSYNALFSSAASAAADDSAEMTIVAAPHQPVSLPSVANPEPYKVRGRAYRFEDGSALKNRQLFIHVAFQTDVDTVVPQVIASPTTDASGYFSFQMPAGAIERAYARIGGAAGPTADLALVANAQANPQQTLVFEGVEVVDDDCACNTATPTDPDAADLVHSPVYSDDLGGTCVSFTTPNRSLEEFDYYAVVRTTEPEIRRVPWQKPPTLSPVVPATSDPGNATQAEVSEAFRARLAQRQEASYGDLENVTGLFGHRPGYASLWTSLNAGDHQWWIFETSMLTFLADKGEERYGPFVGSPLSTGFARLDGIEQLIVALQPQTVFEHYCIDVARDTFVEFYGRTPADENELYTFWTYTAQEFHNRHNRLPNTPDELEDFIRQTLMQTANDGPGEWWLFSIDYGNYTAPQGITPLQHLKGQLAAVFATVYGEAHQLDLELLEFLRLAVSQFRDDYGRIPRTPEELVGYIRLVFESGAGGRTELDGTHAIDWDETPTLYHNTTVAHGHVLHFKQVWRADGYSMGDLLYSLPLAPCQQKQIVIHDWDRHDMATRDEFLSADERMSAYLDRDRDVSDILNTSFSERIKGGSKTKTKGFSFGLGHSGGGGIGAKVPVKGMQFGGVIGSSTGIGAQYSSGNSTSSAWQNSARQLSAKGMNKLRDNVMQGASAVRNQRATVVQVVNQGERTSAQSEVIANHNHCHSITMEYFEVLRHFAIEQRLADVQECLFIPLEMTPFDIHKILRWKSELAGSIYDRELLEGIDALETIEARYLNTGAQPGVLADEEIQDIGGELEFSMVIARPEDDVDSDGEFGFSLARWNALSPLLGPWTPMGVRSHFLGLAQAAREKMFREEILPDILTEFIDALEFGYVDREGTEHVLNLDVVAEAFSHGNTDRKSRLRAFMEEYEPGSSLRLKLRMLPGQSRFTRDEVAWFYVKNDYPLPDGSRVSFRGGNLRYVTANLDEALFNAWNLNDDLGSADSATVRTPLNSRELFNPIQDLYDKANRLINHLNDHLEFYHKVLWYQMDADKRFMMLDGFIAPNSGGRSVASVVENRVVGVVGNNLVMPVARGVHLDPSFAQDGDEPVDLLAHYAPTTPLDPFRISVPTRGVYAEAVMGSCNSCEKIDESRHWRFEEVPCGSKPTEIEPLSLASRYQAPGNLQPKDFAEALVALQDLPDAPDPASLSALIEAMATPGVFGDFAGLNQNQLNALKALKANQKGAIEAMRMNTEAATKYAQMAKELAMHNSMVKNADKVIDRTEEQMEKGNMSEEDGKDVIKTALRTMGGGLGSLFGDGAGHSGGEGGTQGGSQGDGRRINVSPTRDMLPENPAQFTSYEANSGSGDAVKFTTPGDGSAQVTQTDPPPLELRADFFSSGIDVSAFWRFSRCLNVPHGTSWHPAFLGEGAVGEPVLILQKALNVLDPNLGLTEDGQFGPSTAQAVRNFQSQFAAGGFITMVDGVVGPETMRILDEAMYHIEEEGLSSITPAQVQDIRDALQRQVQLESALTFPLDADADEQGTRNVWEGLMHLCRIVTTTNRLDYAGMYDVIEPIGSLGGHKAGTFTQEQLSLGDYIFDITTNVPHWDYADINNASLGWVQFLATNTDTPKIRLVDNNGNNIVTIHVWANASVVPDGRKFYRAMHQYINGEILFEELLDELSLGGS